MDSRPPAGMSLTPAQLELLDQSVYDALQLPERAANHLESINVYTLYELLMCTREQLLAIPNFGDKTLADVYARLAKVGFVRQGGCDQETVREPNKKSLNERQNRARKRLPGQVWRNGRLLRENDDLYK